MNEVSTFRLWVLRAGYALVFVGLATSIWPLIVRPPDDLQLMRGVVWSMLTAVSLLAALGLRYPLKMLPVLFFELIWKVTWMIAIGLPRLRAGMLDEAAMTSFFEILFGIVVVPLLLPWAYVWRQFVKAPSDRWRRKAG